MNRAAGTTLRLPPEILAQILAHVADLPPQPILALSPQHTLLSAAFASKTLAAIAVPLLWKAPSLSSDRSVLLFMASISLYPPSHIHLSLQPSGLLQQSRSNPNTHSSNSRHLDPNLFTSPISASGRQHLKLIRSLKRISSQFRDLLRRLIIECPSLCIFPLHAWTVVSSIPGELCANLANISALQVVPETSSALAVLMAAINTKPESIEAVSDALLPSDRKLALLIASLPKLSYLSIHEAVATASPDLILESALHVASTRLTAVRVVNGPSRKRIPSSSALKPWIECANIKALALEGIDVQLSEPLPDRPHLRVLHLIDCSFGTLEAFKNIISAAPCLEILVIKSCKINYSTLPINPDSSYWKRVRTNAWTELIESFPRSLFAFWFEKTTLSSLVDPEDSNNRTEISSSHTHSQSSQNSIQGQFRVSESSVAIWATRTPFLKYLHIGNINMTEGVSTDSEYVDDNDPADQSDSDIHDKRAFYHSITHAFPTLYSLHFSTSKCASDAWIESITEPLKCIRSLSIAITPTLTKRPHIFASTRMSMNAALRSDQQPSDKTLQDIARRFSKTLEHLRIPAEYVSWEHGVQVLADECTELRSAILTGLNQIRTVTDVSMKSATAVAIASVRLASFKLYTFDPDEADSFDSSNFDSIWQFPV